MDKYFLEFWGKFLLNASKSQKQLEDMTQWVQQGFKGFEDLTVFFKKAYGLDEPGEGSPTYLRVWKDAEAQFRQSLRDYMRLVGVVPREEHLALVRKYEQLKEKAASQEETIKHLRMLTQPDGAGQTEAAKQFDDLIKMQSEQFQKIIDSFKQVFTNDAQTREEEDRGES